MSETPKIAADEDGEFACASNHVITARLMGYRDQLDLEGHPCPLCLGEVEGHESLIDNRNILAPMQKIPEAQP